MIVHIVFFKFKDENKNQNIEKVKELLEALPSKISQIREFEIGIDFNKSERAMDLSLYSTFDSQDDLKSYAIDKEHLKVVDFIKEVTEYTKVVDYTRL